MHPAATQLRGHSRTGQPCPAHVARRPAVQRWGVSPSIHSNHAPTRTITMLSATPGGGGGASQTLEEAAAAAAAAAEGRGRVGTTAQSQDDPDLQDFHHPVDVEQVGAVPTTRVLCGLGMRAAHTGQAGVA